MKEEKILLDKFGNKSPYVVPEGFFESFRAEIEGKLPEHPEAPKPVQLSIWQRIKPYAYLAAMFAGIWMMMQVFHNVAGGDQLNIDNPPAQIAALMSDPEVIDVYDAPVSISDEELIDEASQDYSSIEDFEKDFNYSFKPQYDNIKL